MFISPQNHMTKPIKNRCSDERLIGWPMPTLGDIFRLYAEPFLKHYAHSLNNEQKKAILDISSCRTGMLGTTVYKCKKCATFHQVNNSCGNRHCPGCQNHKTGEWLEKQLRNLLGVDYFFGTLPQSSIPWHYPIHASSTMPCSKHPLTH